MQKRALVKITFPGRWDTSAAGHVSAGESAEETARREVQEELGLTELPEMEFLLIGKCVGSLHGGSFKEYEFEHVYAIFIDDDLLPKLKFNLQETEVMDVQWMPIEKVREAWKRKDDAFVNVGDPSFFDTLTAFVHKHLKK